LAKKLPRIPPTVTVYPATIPNTDLANRQIRRARAEKLNITNLAPLNRAIEHSGTESERGVYLIVSVSTDDATEGSVGSTVRQQ
jgi:hypothetical protein